MATKKLRTLAVYANPYLHLDADGLPQAALPWDPIGHNPGRGWVGAELKAETGPAYEPGDPRQPDHRIWFEFSDEPQVLPDTPYYRMAIARGELVIADKATADACGVSFVDPATALAKHKANALAHRKAHHGDEPACLAGHAFGPAARAPDTSRPARFTNPPAAATNTAGAGELAKAGI